MLQGNGGTMRNALVLLGLLLSVGCGPALTLEDFLGNYEGHTTVTGPGDVPRDGAQTMSVFRSLTAAERIRFAEFSTLGSKAAQCPFDAKLADGALSPVLAKCWDLLAVDGKSCNQALMLKGGTVSLLNKDELTVSLSGDVVKADTQGRTCPPDVLGRFTLVFAGHRTAQ